MTVLQGSSYLLCPPAAFPEPIFIGDARENPRTQLGNKADVNKNEEEKHGREGEVSSVVDDKVHSLGEQERLALAVGYKSRLVIFRLCCAPTTGVNLN